MLTLLKSLAREKASLDSVENWINSNLISSNDAQLAFEKGFILVANEQNIQMVYLTQQGLSYLQQFDKMEHFGKTKWDPNLKLQQFMNKYSKDTF